MEGSKKSTGIKRESPKMVCGVCDDRAKSFHFGGISCDSCKAFFRRAVQNNGYKKFGCGNTNKCVINKSTRKSCQKCRFEKCVSIGMEIKWVMSEEERLLHNLTRSRVGPTTTADKQKRESVDDGEDRNDLSLPPNQEDMLQFMSPEEKLEIESITLKYQDAYAKIPYNVSETNGNRGPVEIVNMFTTIIRRFALFCKSIDDFSRLSPSDQQNLLKAGVLEMCLLRGAFVFDMDNNRWPGMNINYLKDCPSLRLDDMEKLVSSELYDMHKRFISSIQKLKADEPTVTLLLLVVLFYPDRAEVQDYSGISQSQEKFILLLQKYIQWRYGPKSGLFPRLLSKLSDLRQLNDSHTAYNLKLDQEDLHVIQNQLEQMNLNPYSQWEETTDQSNVAASEHQNWTNTTVDWNHFAHSGMENLGFLQQTQTGNDGGQRSGNPAPAYFQHFITEKIPTLIQNPFAPISFEADILQARAFFQNSSNKPGHMEMMQKVAAFANLKNLSLPTQSEGQNGPLIDFQTQPTIPSFMDHIPPHNYENVLPQFQQNQQEIKEMAANFGTNDLGELRKNLENSLLFGNGFPSDISALLANYSSGHSGGEDWTQPFSSHNVDCHKQMSEAEMNSVHPREN